MTIEEKANAIKKYCNGTTCTGGCPLSNIERNTCFEEYKLHPNEIERNYNIIFGSGETAEDPVGKHEDSVNHPSHYTQGGIECIDAMKSAFGADELAVYCKIAAFKYIWRCELKNGSEDVKKAIWYLQKFLELEAENGT